jgi:hypothetical protein
MNLVELEKIEEALRSDKITFAEAGEKIFGLPTKPWQTKKKRNELIKDSCEQCGSTKPPLVLQYMWHPSSYRNHVRVAYESFLENEKRFVMFAKIFIFLFKCMLDTTVKKMVILEFYSLR